MKPLRKITAATAAVIAIAGLAGVAAAEVKNSHVLTIHLPDGSQEQIRYVGDQPPEVRLQRAQWAAFSPLTDQLDLGSSFAALDRISTQMDREAATMLRQVHSLPAPLFDNRGGIKQVALNSLAPGVQGYSVVSTLSGGHVCTRMTQYRSQGSAGQPEVLTRISGDCGVDDGKAATATADHRGRPGVIAVHYAPSRSAADARLIHSISATD